MHHATGQCDGDRVPRFRPTTGWPDYVLFAERRPLAVVEAKRLWLSPQGVLAQAERYGRGVAGSPLDFDGVHVSFLY